MKCFIQAARLIFAIILTAALLASVSGCAGGSDVGNPESVTFASDDTLLAFLVDEFAQSVLPETFRAEKSNDDQGGAPAVSDETGYSQTNIQETGVDESDKAKTDGRFIFVAGDDCVNIVDTTVDGAMEKIGRININGYVDSLYLYADTLVTLYTPEYGNGEAWAGESEIKAIDMGMPYWIPVNAKTGILVADVSNPANPSVLKDFQADGVVVASRLTGGRLHVISQFFPDIPMIDVWYDGSEKDREDTYENNRQKLDGLSLDDFIPSFETFDAEGVMTETGRLVATENFLRPKTPNGGSIISIISMNMDDLSSDIETLGFIADVHHIYASQENLYLTSTVFNNIFTMEADSDVPENETLIYQFDLTSATVNYSAAGSVPGQILNQFSLGEYDNVLRIASSTGYTWDGSSESHVFCLDANQKNLKIIGRLDGLAPGERLYASRFIGDKGFLVTFVEIDPLFTIDLSDPHNPTVAGELKVPGYSTYVHPFGDNYLLTIGKDAAVDGGFVWYQGLQLSIFDISDFKNPVLIAKSKIGDRGTDSEALFNHKAFTFWTERNWIALPVDLHEYLSPPTVPWEYGTQTFFGLYVYRITGNNQLSYAGRIPMHPETHDTFYYPDWLRGIFIDQTIYAVNKEEVKSANTESVSQVVDRVDLTP